jgi:hypothetical protein
VGFGRWQSKKDADWLGSFVNMSLSVNAGRSYRVTGTNRVEASTTKGTLALGPGEEGLLHLTWKDRETNAVEDVRFNIHTIRRGVLMVRHTTRI